MAILVEIKAILFFLGGRECRVRWDYWMCWIEAMGLQ